MDDCRHTDEETEAGCEADGHQACGCGWRRQRQQRTAQRLPRSCQALWMDHLHPQVQLHDGQCRYDRHCGVLQVSGQGVLSD